MDRARMDELALKHFGESAVPLIRLMRDNELLAALEQVGVVKPGKAEFISARQFMQEYAAGLHRRLKRRRA